MKIKVILESEYEIDRDFDEMEIDGIEDVVDMESLEVLDDHAKVITTRLVSAELLEEETTHG